MTQQQLAVPNLFSLVVTLVFLALFGLISFSLQLDAVGSADSSMADSSMYTTPITPITTDTSRTTPIITPISPSEIQSNTNRLPYKPRVVVIGPVRDAANALTGLQSMFRRLQSHMEIVHILFFENDSKDKTVEILENEWKANFSVHVASETNLTGTRTVVLAHARNRLWELVGALPDQSFDYVLAVDMDKANLNLAHVETCWNGALPANWSVCCANTYRIYYDLWALRTYDQEWVGDRDVLQISKPERQNLFRHIPASAQPIPVKSCFGGAALYNYQQIRHLNLTTYKGVSENGVDWICEHVVFHEQLRKQLPSIQMFIQPTMLNNGKPRGPAVRKRLKSEVRKSFTNPNLTYYYSTIQNQNLE